MHRARGWGVCCKLRTTYCLGERPGDDDGGGIGSRFGTEELASGLVDTMTPRNGLYDGSEVVVHKDNVENFLRRSCGSRVRKTGPSMMIPLAV